MRACAGDYTEAVATAAEEHLDFVMGFISISPAKWAAKPSPGLIHMTPGVQLTEARRRPLQLPCVIASMFQLMLGTFGRVYL